MAHIAKEQLLDCSGEESFSFALCCEHCGWRWESSPVPFSKAGCRPEDEGERLILSALYLREREAAAEMAARQAQQHFSMCPICRRIVCDRCFMVCDNLDMCVSCAGKLQENGETVS